MIAPGAGLLQQSLLASSVFIRDGYRLPLPKLEGATPAVLLASYTQNARRAALLDLFLLPRPRPTGFQNTAAQGRRLISRS